MSFKLSNQEMIISTLWGNYHSNFWGNDHSHFCENDHSHFWGNDHFLKSGNDHLHSLYKLAYYKIMLICFLSLIGCTPEGEQSDLTFQMSNSTFQDTFHFNGNYTPLLFRRWSFPLMRKWSFLLEEMIIPNFEEMIILSKVGMIIFIPYISLPFVKLCSFAFYLSSYAHQKVITVT